MSVTKEQFGVLRDGRPVTAYNLSNGNISAKVIDFGAELVSLSAPDSNGNHADLLLGFDDAAGYETNKDFFGSLVGPVANRTADARFSIDGVTYQMPVNDGPNNLHTDFDHGFHKKMWKALAGTDFVTFTLSSPDGEYGLPGNKDITVTYTVTPANGLKIHYHAVTDRKTVLNPTNHAYWNLDGEGSGSMEGTLLTLYCSYFTPVRKGAIPTGEIRPVAGTVFDFTKEKPIGRDIEADEEQLRLVGGYDHNFVIDGTSEDGVMAHAAKAVSPVSGRVMDVYTTLPGIQFYAGNFVDDKGCKGGKPYGRRSAFALETQFYPDSVNHDNFPDVIFDRNRVYDSVTEYRFSIR